MSRTHRASRHGACACPRPDQVRGPAPSRSASRSGIAAAVYGVVLQAIDWLFFAGVSATLVLYQIVNFHHYIVDALIWKTRRPAAARGAFHAS